ncbi:MAG: hypothetical protein IJ787_03220 [Bacilli bacterium]|nr:hypothetical protein [Bacilli bacterium]
MSNNKKKKKTKKISPETAANLKLGFSTLISNDGVIKASREWKGVIDILPICLALIAVILAVLPTFVSRMNTKGSTAIFNSPVAAYDQGLAQFENSLIYDDAGNQRDLKLTIDGTGTFNFSKEDRVALTGGDNQWYTAKSSSGKPVFEVFFNSTAFNDSEFFAAIDKGQDPYTQTARDNSATASETYVASYLAFGKEYIRFRKKSETGVAFAGLTGRYDRLIGKDFTAFAKSLDSKEYTSKAYIEQVTGFYSEVINLSFETDKVVGAWSQTGIFAAIDLGLVVLFGVVLFLMTRGKKNPFRIYTFWETQKMAYWAAFTPSLIALILGFWLVQYAFIFFMFAYGMRMMWMSMRSLRPAQ